MLKDFTRDDWLSILNIPESRIPSALLLRGTRNLRSNYEKHAAFFSDVVEIGSPNGIFEDILIGEYQGADMGYASVYGDAMASEVTHLFGALGTRLVVQTGCCGALGDGILPGDIVCATSARCGEGASQYYTPGVKDISASPDLIARVPSSVGEITVHKGAIRTTSALLAEGMDEVMEWRDQGCIAADMETASTFAVAEYFGMRRLSLLFAFDNPCLGDHILMIGDEEKSARRASGEQAMIDLALAIIKASAA